MNDYIKLTLKIGLYFFIYIASMFAFSIVGTIAVMILGMDPMEQMGKIVFMGGIGTLFSIFIFWIMLKNKKKDLINLCNFDAISLKSTLLMIPIAIGFGAFVMIYSALVYKYDLVPDMEVYMEMAKAMMPTITGIIAIVIIAPITEEILFRGLIFNFLREKISITSSIIIQALLFGIIHLNKFQGLFAFAAGILFGIIYVWTKSIWSVIILHALNNFLAVVSMQFYEELKYIDMHIFIAIGVVLFIPSLWLLYKENITKPETKRNPF